MENRTDSKLGGQVKAMKWNIRKKYGAKGPFVRDWIFCRNKRFDDWLLTLPLSNSHYYWWMPMDGVGA